MKKQKEPKAKAKKRNYVQTDIYYFLNSKLQGERK